MNVMEFIPIPPSLLPSATLPVPCNLFPIPYACGLSSRCGDPVEQTGCVWHLAFSLVPEDRFAIHPDRQVASLPGLDFCFDSKLLLRRFLQAHGCPAQIQSKETTLNFNIHWHSPAAWIPTRKLYGVSEKQFPAVQAIPHPMSI